MRRGVDFRLRGNDGKEKSYLTKSLSCLRGQASIPFFLLLLFSTLAFAEAPELKPAPDMTLLEEKTALDEPEILPDANSSTAAPGAKLEKSDPRETPPPVAFGEIQESPTQSVEAYEESRKKMLHERSYPDWSAGISIRPMAYRHAEIRTPPVPGFEKPRPALTGITFGAERMLFTNRYGLLSVGLDIGITGNFGDQERFDYLERAFLTFGPTLQYQFNYIRNQWFVPIARGSYEWTRYKYLYNRATVQDMRGMPRWEVGMLVFLNPLEPNSAGDMFTTYGIKRTYLSIVYSRASDVIRRDFDMSENTFKVGLRFEF